MVPVFTHFQFRNCMCTNIGNMQCQYIVFINNCLICTFYQKQFEGIKIYLDSIKLHELSCHVVLMEIIFANATAM